MLLVYSTQCNIKIINPTDAKIFSTRVAVFIRSVYHVLTFVTRYKLKINTDLKSILLILQHVLFLIFLIAFGKDFPDLLKDGENCYEDGKDNWSAKTLYMDVCKQEL